VARIRGEVLIRRPVEEVFDFVADERNEPTYNPTMLVSEKVTEGPIGAGARFRATIRSGRRPVDMQIEYTAFDRPHMLASTSRMAAADFTGTLTFTPTPAGTRLRWSWQARPKGAMRLLTPVFGPIGARQERRIWTALRDHLEAESHAGSLLDRYLPEFDVRERHSRVLHADVEAVHAALGQADLTGIPVVRALLALRALPGRLRARLGGPATPVPPPFTLADMPRAGWTALAEGPEEVAFGTLTRPWRLGNEAPLVVDRESFAAFSTPGYAKIAFSIRADPEGPHRTRVTTETRVATTDPRSKRRVTAYWVVVGPVSALIRRLILRALAGTSGRASVRSSEKEIAMTYVEPPAVTRRLVNPLVSRLRTGGVATLTVAGRNSGRPRTVPVIPVELNGIRYLVSPFGESDWVRNLRKAGTGQLRSRAGMETFRTTELPVAQRPPIIAAYRTGGRRDVDRYFTRLPDAADHPVFQVTPTTSQPQTRGDS